MTLNISSKLLDMLQAEADATHPAECCGILLGEGNAVTQIAPAKNTHTAPETHFEIDPAALIAAHKAQRTGGQRILGYYHSHPTGSPDPSPTDQAMAARDGKIWIIIGQNETGGSVIKFWRDVKAGFEPLSYAVMDA